MLVRLWHGIEYSADASFWNCTTGGKMAEQSILASQAMAVADSTVMSGSGHEEGAEPE